MTHVYPGDEDDYDDEDEELGPTNESVALNAVCALGEDLRKAQAELKLFHKICRPNVKLSSAGRAVAKYALEHKDQLDIRWDKQIAKLLKIKPSALSRIGNAEDE
jgi:hypothetical protein